MFHERKDTVDGWMDGWMDGWIGVGWTNDGVDGRTNGWKEGQTIDRKMCLII